MNSKNKLFLVEDEGFFAQSVAEGLQNYNYEVTIYGSGEEMLDELDRDLPDAIVLDYHLDNSIPRAFNGKQILEILNVRYPGIPVIMLTSMSSMEEAVSLIRKGAVDFILKDDLFFENLKKSLENVFTVREMTKEINELKVNIKKLKFRVLIVLLVIISSTVVYMVS